MPQPVMRGADNRKSNFEISYAKGGNEYTSMTKMA
jgi:hypothetical protein